MIEIIKARLFGDARENSLLGKLVALTFKYRNDSLKLEGYEKDQKPYLGAVLSTEGAVLLRDWLIKCIDDNQKYCDRCYDFKMNPNINVCGEIHCHFCKALLWPNDKDKA